jgi:hypothetical protein
MRRRPRATGLPPPGDPFTPGPPGMGAGHAAAAPGQVANTPAQSAVPDHGGEATGVTGRVGGGLGGPRHPGTPPPKAPSVPRLTDGRGSSHHRGGATPTGLQGQTGRPTGAPPNLGGNHAPGGATPPPPGGGTGGAGAQGAVARGRFTSTPGWWRSHPRWERLTTYPSGGGPPRPPYQAPFTPTGPPTPRMGPWGPTAPARPGAPVRRGPPLGGPTPPYPPRQGFPAPRGTPPPIPGATRDPRRETPACPGGGRPGAVHHTGPPTPPRSPGTGIQGVPQTPNGPHPFGPPGEESPGHYPSRRRVQAGQRHRRRPPAGGAPLPRGGEPY